MSKMQKQQNTARLPSYTVLFETVVPVPLAVRFLQLGVRGFRGSGNRRKLITWKKVQGQSKEYCGANHFRRKLT